MKGKKAPKELPFNPATPLYNFAWSILYQIIGIAVALGFAFTAGGLWQKLYAIGLSQQEIQIAISLILLTIHSITAFTLAWRYKLPRSWQIFNLLLGPGYTLYQQLRLPYTLATVLLAVLLLIYIPTFWTRVPFYPTSKPMYEAILEQLPADRPFRFIDLGCGFGTMLAYLVRRRPQGSFEGVEISPFPYLVARLRFFFYPSSRAQINFKNFWNFSFEPYDIVYAFLAPGPMPQLWQKVKKELRKGSIFLVNSFAVDHKADKVVEVKDARKSQLFIYRR